MKKFSKKNGFSLIEMLIAIALIGIFSIAVSQVFILIIRSQSKSEITKEVKQNGDYAFSVMENMIRNATDVTNSCPYNNQQSVQIKNPNGDVTTFMCDGTQIASISAFGTQYLTSINVNVPSASCSFTVVCPALAGSSPKYVFMTFTVSQPNPAAGTAERATETYQGTVSLRTY